MMMRSTLLLGVLMFSAEVMALSPGPGFTVKNKLGDVTSWGIPGKDIEINGMASDFEYADLTEKELKSLKDLIVTKQEYGKMFGFADWKPSGQKLLEKNGERIALIQGTYKDAQKKTVHFIEVYWATKENSGQYLITSDSLPLKMDQYSEYLK